MNCKMAAALFLGLLISACSSGPKKAGPEKSALTKTTTQIAFGSCNHQKHKSQPLWAAIAKDKPSVFIWTGDVIYDGSGKEELLRAAYKEQKQNPDYQKFLKTSGAKIIGVWDDNDYGQNNGGQWFKGREFSQQAFLDFLDEPKTSSIRKQKGIYRTHTFGEGDRQIKVYLLDIRYHRERPVDSGLSDILGKEQWAWLEKELKSSQAPVNVFVSGIQFIPKDHRFEKWDLHKNSRSRFFQLLHKYNTQGVVLISGDRHISEFSKLPGKDYYGQQPIHEITASGMTHAYDGFTGEKNRYRVGEVFFQKNFGWMSVDWSKTPAEITLEIRDEHGKTQRTLTYPAIKL